MITTRCTECGASSIDGMLTHADTCTAAQLVPKKMDFVKLPAIEIHFSDKEEQERFMKNLTKGSKGLS